MSCDEVQAVLSDAIDGNEVDEAGAAAHLEGCAACGRVARELSSVHRLLLETRAAELLVKPATKKRTKLPRRPSPRTAPKPTWLLPFAIGASLFFAVALAQLLRTPEPVAPKPAPPVAAAKRSLGTLNGKDLFEGDAAKGAGTFTWRDGTKMDLAEGCAIERLDENDNGKLVVVARGTLSADVVPQPAGRPLLFTTPHGEARVLGTTLTLKVDLDSKKGTRLEVGRGKVELRNVAGRSVIVEGGYYAVSVDLVARKTEAPGWQNATGGAPWGAADVTLLAAVPDRDELIAGVADAWLWSSVDGGASWKKLGGGDIRNKPHHLIFDPVNPRRFWVCGIYGPGIFRTDNGGASFRRLGALDHIDGLAVDFSDPARRTLLATHHLDPAALEKSVDGGETWERIGARLPPTASSSSAVFIVDARTYLALGQGAVGAPLGIYRSADAGATWTRASTRPGSGPPLLASDGALYWQPYAGLGDTLMKSVDRGATWIPMKGPVRTTPVEIAGGKLVAGFEKQYYVSSDGAVTWTKLGEPAPILSRRTFTGMTYEAVVSSPARRAIYIWRDNSEKPAEAIFRLQLPE